MTSPQEERIAALVQWIAGELACGRRQEDIARDLEGEGLAFGDAMRTVDRVATQMSAAAPAGASFGERISGAAGGLLLMLVAFAVLNGFLYVGQGVLKRGTVAEARALEAQLDELDSEISLISTWLGRKDQESREIDALGDRLDQPSVHYASQEAHERDLARYNRMIEVWNREAVPQVRASVLRHDRLVEEFNALVPRYDEVASSAYARWWLLPIPAPRGRRGVRR